MLSVLIPVYRYEVLPLVQDLINQLIATDIEWELRVYDDASPAQNGLPKTLLDQFDDRFVYRVLPKNLGRAAIRNLLAREARYNQLIFLDADGEIPSQFIEGYLPFLGQDVVVSGGRCYNDRAIRPDQQLHWNYGTQRESKPAKARNQHPYEGFQTNNFLATKALLLRHPFDEAATAYGHEDTLWGWQLKAMGMEIVHIDNAVAHLGLEDAETFLHKQQTAVSTLKILEAKHPELPSRLGEFAQKIEWAKPVLLPLLSLATSLAQKRLRAVPPASLYWLDLLKLKWYFS